MKDYLRELCKQFGLGLVYEDSESVILSTGVLNSIPTIKANHIFKECLKDVAEAVIGYYIDFEHKDKYFNMLKSYAEDNLITVDFEIKPPDKRFKSHLGNNTETNMQKQSPAKELKKDKTVKNPQEIIFDEKPVDKDTTSLVEMNISKIVQKDFWGNIKEVNEDRTVKPESEGILELDIVINQDDM